MLKEKEIEEKETKENKNIIYRNSSCFSHVENHKVVCELPKISSGEYVVDDSCFIPMSEAIKQLQRINDPTTGQLSEVYDFPNGKDTGKQIPITRRRDFGDLAEYSQEIRNSSEKMNEEILKGQLEKAEKEAFEKELEAVKVNASSSNKE